MRTAALFIALGVALGLSLASGLASAAGAAPSIAEGFHFRHNDWEVACDNTGICRAAGYHEDRAELPVSVLVTRRPGPGTRPEVKLVLGSYDEPEAVKALPPRPVLTMRVNNRSLGAVRLGGDGLSSTLSRAQAAALLAALPKAQARVSWHHGDAEWVLSDQGARAVMLKMDEAQGRLGTPGALVDRGTRDERQVPGRRPPPLLKVSAIPPTLEADRAWPQRQGTALLAALRATVADGRAECSLLEEDDPTPWEVRRLNDRQLLVSTRCWLAAYNGGSGVWVVNRQPPYAPVLVTDSATDITDTEIIASHKVRGLGDCWSHEAWAWIGSGFVRSSAGSSGLCKLIEPGGPWHLPTLVTRVQQSR